MFHVFFQSENNVGKTIINHPVTTHLGMVYTTFTYFNGMMTLTWSRLLDHTRKIILAQADLASVIGETTRVHTTPKLRRGTWGHAFRWCWSLVGLWLGELYKVMVFNSCIWTDDSWYFMCYSFQIRVDKWYKLGHHLVKMVRLIRSQPPTRRVQLTQLKWIQHTQPRSRWLLCIVLCIVFSARYKAPIADDLSERLLLSEISQLPSGYDWLP